MKDFAVSRERKETDLAEKIIYQIVFKMFTVEGTIQAAASRLEHIASLGVDIIYLSPFFEADDDMDRSAWSERQISSGMNNPKNPYRICDYFKIDPEYGDETDLKEFIDKAHGLGMKVIFDLVYMHCGPSKFVKEHPTFVQRKENGEIISSRYNFPYLDYNNPELCEYMWSNMLLWVEKFDVDGYRCDVADRVPLFFWREGRRRIEAVKKPVYLINEGEDPEYLLEVFDGAYYNHDFSWNEVIQKAVKGNKRGLHHIIRMIYEALAARNPDGAILLRAYENHDFVVDSFEERIDRTHGDITDALMVLNFVIDGTPMLYSGNEFAECRRHSMWRWSGDEYCLDWSVLDTERGQKRLELTKKLCELRHCHSVLCHGKTTMIKSEQLLAFLREDCEYTVKAWFNFGDKTVEQELTGGEVLVCGNSEISDGMAAVKKGGYLVELIAK